MTERSRDMGYTFSPAGVRKTWMPLFPSRLQLRKHPSVFVPLAFLAVSTSIYAESVGYELVRELRGDGGFVNGVACSPDGGTVVVACDNGKVTLINPLSANRDRSFPTGQGPIYSVAIRGDGRVLATAGFDGTIRTWDLLSGKELQVCRGHMGWINAVTFAAAGRELVSAGRDCTVRSWEADTGKCLRIMTDYPSEVFSVAVSKDGRWFASDKGDSISVRLFETGREVVGGIPGQWGINTLLFGPGPDAVITSGYDGKVWQWNLTAATVAHEVAVEGGPIISVAIPADGGTLAALCTGDRTVKLLDTKSWKVVGHLPGVAYPTGGVAFSADGRWLVAAGGDSPVRIWRRH